LLKDKRVYPSVNNNYVRKNGHLEIVKLLLENKKVDLRDYKK
jgi:hypothetical protein